MFSFKQFLEERKVSPEALANRVARRYGKKAKYGKWLRAEPGGHIPLNRYKAREADSVFNRSDKLREKIGGKHYYGSSNKVEQDKAIKRFNDAHTPRTMNIKDLHPTQPYVETQHPERLRQKLAETQPKHIVVATHKGKHYILDGHHSVMAAHLRGEKTVNVKYIDMDKY